MRQRSQHFDPRQTMQTDTFEVFHYRDTNPGTVEMHHHDFYELYCLLEGRVEYWVEGRVIRLQPGDILLLSPMELHRPVVQPESPLYERIVLWIRKDWLEAIPSATMGLGDCFDPSRPTHTNLLRPDAAQRGELTALLGTLVAEYYSREPGSDLCAYGLLLQLMTRLNRLVLESPRVAGKAASALVQKALQYIGEHLSGELSLEQVAAACYVSKYHLSHAFSREVGVSLYRYVLLRRLVLARQLLAEGVPAGQVCQDCGFSDYAGFYRAFKAEYGISPREFSGGSGKV